MKNNGTLSANGTQVDNGTSIELSNDLMQLFNGNADETVGFGWMLTFSFQ